MDSMGWPYDSFDCLSFLVHDSNPVKSTTLWTLSSERPLIWNFDAAAMKPVRSSCATLVWPRYMKDTCSQLCHPTMLGGYHGGEVILRHTSQVDQRVLQVKCAVLDWFTRVLPGVDSSVIYFWRRGCKRWGLPNDASRWKGDNQSQKLPCVHEAACRHHTPGSHRKTPRWKKSWFMISSTVQLTYLYSMYLNSTVNICVSEYIPTGCHI